MLIDQNKFNSESLGRLAHPIANRLLALAKEKHLESSKIKFLEDIIKNAAE